MKCVACQRADATAGRYCWRCLDVETQTLSDEELDAAWAKLDELLADALARKGNEEIARAFALDGITPKQEDEANG